jgi:hypothetical protein
MVGLGFGGHHYLYLVAIPVMIIQTECRLTTGSAVGMENKDIFPADYMVHCGAYIQYVIIIIKNKINEKDAT